MTIPNATSVESFLLPDRDVLALFGDFAPLQRDLELHLVSNGITYDPFVRTLLSDGLIALGLHVASRPVDEHVGWTVSIQDPLLNLFFAGSSSTESLVGRAFVHEEEIKVRDTNLFVCESKREHGDRQESYIEVSGLDVFAMAEKFYRESEQKLGRFFHGDGEVGLLVTLPDAEGDWLPSTTAEEVFELRKEKKMRFLATRKFIFGCGCNGQKIGASLATIYGENLDELFGEDERLEVECPRCGSSIGLTREDLQGPRSSGED